MLYIRKIVKGFKSDGFIDTKFFENTPNYDYLFDGSPSYSAQNVLTQDQFISDIYKSMAGSMSEELDKIFKLMIDFLVAKEAQVRVKFEGIYRLPIIPDFDVNLGPFEWVKAFFRYCKDYKFLDLDVNGLQSIYQSLNITKILNEGNSSSEAENIFKHISQRIVADYGIDAYESLMDFLSKQSHTDSPSQEENEPRSLRHEVLDEIFSNVNLDGQNNQSLFTAVTNTFKSVEFLSLGALKILADWIKENQIIECSFAKAEFVQMSSLILQSLDDEQFIAVSNMLRTQIAGMETPSALQSNVNNRSDYEFKCITEIISLKSNVNLNISSACKSALNSITAALGMIYEDHKPLGVISLRESSSIRAQSGDIHEEEFLRNVAVSDELEKDLLGIRLADDSIEMKVFQSKMVEILHSLQNVESAILLQPSEGMASSDVSVISIPLLSKMQDSIGAVTIKLEGVSQKLNEADAKFMKQALDHLFDIINEIDYRNKLMNISNSAKSYEKAHANLDLQVYLILKNAEDDSGFYKLDDNGPYSESSYSKNGGFVSPFMLSNPSILTELNSNDSNFALLKACVTSNTAVSVNDSTFIPIIGTKKEMIGILRLNLGESNIQDQQIQEGAIISKQLGNALSRISEETVTMKSVINRELGIFNWKINARC